MICTCVNVSIRVLSYTTHLLFGWSAAQPKTSVIMSLVVYESAVYMALQLM